METLITLIQLWSLVIIVVLLWGLVMILRASQAKRQAAVDTRKPMASCRWCGGSLHIVERWSSSKTIGFWVGMLFCFAGLLALFMANERHVVCKNCGAHQ